MKPFHAIKAPSYLCQCPYFSWRVVTWLHFHGYPYPTAEATLAWNEPPILPMRDVSTNYWVIQAFSVRNGQKKNRKVVVTTFGAKSFSTLTPKLCPKFSEPDQNLLTMLAGQLMYSCLCSAASLIWHARNCVISQVWRWAVTTACTKSRSLASKLLSSLDCEAKFFFCICSMILAFSFFGTRPNLTAVYQKKRLKLQALKF